MRGDLLGDFQMAAILQVCGNSCRPERVTRAKDLRRKAREAWLAISLGSVLQCCFVSYTANVINVMIASPSDVPQERLIVRDVISEWNTIHAKDKKTVLMPIGWETHSVPDTGDRPQAIISGQLLKDADLLVAMFWTRIGSPTGAARSGTVEEIEEHIGAGKPAMIYFSSAPVRPDSIDSRSDGCDRTLAGA
jgi:hypothetical protein